MCDLPVDPPNQMYSIEPKAEMLKQLLTNYNNTSAFCKPMQTQSKMLRSVLKTKDWKKNVLRFHKSKSYLIQIPLYSFFNQAVIIINMNSY